jgi:hypothetical protein
MIRAMTEIPFTERLISALILMAAAAIGVIRFFGAKGELPVERVAASLAVVAILATPALFTRLAVGRPPLLLAAGIGLLPVALLPLITCPLVLPALALIVLFARRGPWVRPPGIRHPALRTGAAVAVTVIGLPLAVLALAVHDDPRSWAIGDASNPASTSGSGSTSDITTLAESLGSLAIVALTVFAALAFVPRGGQEDGLVSRATGGAGLAGGPATPPS